MLREKTGISVDSSHHIMASDFNLQLRSLDLCISVFWKSVFILFFLNESETYV